MKLLSDIASELVTVDLPCDDCDATGQQTAIKTNVLNFFAPYEYVRQPCATCFGRGTREAEVCPLCGREENGCLRLCKRTVCCQKHPVECECPEGLELYQRQFGAPGVLMIKPDALVSAAAFAREVVRAKPAAA